MSDTITVEEIRDLYDAALALDAERAMSLMHPDVEVHEPSVLPTAASTGVSNSSPKCFPQR